MDSGHNDGTGGGNGGGGRSGRIGGHNSAYRSGGHAIKSRVKDELTHIFREHIRKSARREGDTVGSRTVELRKQEIESFFSELFKLHYKIESVHNLKQKHLKAVFQNLEAQGQAPSTLQSKISMMRLFCEWIGKPGMVEESSNYVVNPLSTKRTMVVKEDKSWDGNGIDVMVKLEEIRSEDKKIAGVLLLCYGFGLRIREAVMMNVFKSDEQRVLTVIHGTKGGRIRHVPIEHDWQVELLKDLRGIADQKTGKLVERGDTVERSIRRVRWQMEKRGLVLAKAGVTPHGLRHQYMHERFKEQTGVDAPVKGGDISVLDKQEFDNKTEKLMERAGHSRKSIGAAYYGSRRMKKKT